MESWDDVLHGLFFSHLGLRIEDYDIDTAATGLMNYVFRVRTDKGIFYLKQALPTAKANRSLGPALRKISIQRLEFEKNCITEISAVLPDGVLIPVVHGYDRENHILLLSDVAGKDGKIGVIDFELASMIGDPAYDLGFFIGHYLIRKAEALLCLDLREEPDNYKLLIPDVLR